MDHWANFIQLWYVESHVWGHKIYILIETSPVVIEIQEVKNSELAVPVNNTLVRHMAFLATDT